MHYDIKKNKCGHFCFMSLKQTTITKHNWNKLLILLEPPKHTIHTPEINSG